MPTLNIGMQIQLTTGNYGRQRLGLPQTRLINAYVESSPGGPLQDIRTTRPGLTQVYNVGQGPILAIFQQPGLFNGDVFAVSGNALYRNGALLGSVSYSQNPQMAAANGQLAIVAGGALYIYDGTVFKNQIFFDDGVSLLPEFSGVSVLYDIFVYPVTGSDQFFFSQAGDASTINAGDYSAAQTAPDDIVQSYVLAEEIYFFGQTSVEIWDYNPQVNSAGQVNAPFTLSQGRTYRRGCAAQGSVRALDNALFWVGEDLCVYRTSTVPSKISTSFIDGRLREAGPLISQMTSMTYNIEGHVVYVINLPTLNESYGYDCQTEQWFRIGTQDGRDSDPGLFCGSVCAGQGSTTYVGSASDGRVWLFDTGNHTDDGTPIQVVISGAIWLNEGVHRANNICLQCVRGTADASTPDPVVEMRWSDDGGRTYTSWWPGQLAFVGSYQFKVTWRALGLVRSPGRLIEIRISSPVVIAVEGISANAARV